MMRSPCCDAAVKRVCGDAHADMWSPWWYACTACGQPCDPVEKEGEK